MSSSQNKICERKTEKYSFFSYTTYFALNIKSFMTGEKKLKVFLDILLELKDAGTNFSDDDLRDEVVTMMVGVRQYIYNIQS